MGRQDRTSRRGTDELDALRREIGQLRAARKELQRAEDALKASEERYRLLVENANAVIEITQDGTVKFSNAKTMELTGYSPDELASKPFADIIHPDDREMLIDRNARRLKGEEIPHIYPFRIIDRFGNIKWVEINAVTVSWEGRPAVLSFLTDITERKRMEEELERREKYFRSVVENAMDGIAIIDGAITVRYASPSFERITGYAIDDRIGKNPLELVHPDDMPKATDAFAALAKNPDRVQHVDVRVKHRDGSWRTIDVVGRNLLDDPAVGGIVVNFRDISERKHHEETLKDLFEQERGLRERLEDEMNRRVEFIRVMTHELKTPLTSVLASSDLLVSELKDGALAGLAANVSLGASAMNNRIDELLDLAKGEVGILQLRCDSVDLLQILRQVADSMRPLAQKHGQSLVLDTPAYVPSVQADYSRVQQVITNLVGNAIKFTPENGKITLRAKVKDGEVVVEVQDTGHGIPQRELKDLFEPYHRRQADAEGAGGLGVGLYLCKTLVELHGGRIWARSRVGMGSTFCFSLPAEVARGEPHQQEEQAKLWKILFIEDDQPIVDAMSLAFELRWPESQLLSTRLGESGIELVESESPDAVVLDLVLPDISGFEVLRQIRLFSAVPVVVLSVRADESDVVKALELGADDYVSKPFRQLELLARLKVQVRKPQGTSEGGLIFSGSLRYDPSACQLSLGGKEIGLTVIEGKIIECLIRNAGHVVTHSRLAEAVWGDDYPGALVSLRAYIRRLRDKIGEHPGHPELILTRSGIGYLLAKPS